MGRVRVNRVGEQIKKELGQIIQRELKDPRIGFVTVTGVELSGDLQIAKVFVTIYGDEEVKSTTLKALEKAKGFMRGEIGKRISLRHTPELIFKLDESIEYGSRIEEILAKLHKQEEEGKE